MPQEQNIKSQDAEDLGKAHLSISKNIKKGDLVKFGSYYQNDPNKKEPIEWIVLDKQGDQALLLSKYALDCKPYHNIYEEEDINWKDSFLRRWCNSYFINVAFNEEARELLIERDNKNHAAHDTHDQMFILSLDEVNEYLPNELDRKCRATKFALDRGAYSGDDGFSYWWLRTHNDEKNYPSTYFVIYDGTVQSAGTGNVDSCNLTVRPACLVKLS